MDKFIVGSNAFFSCIPDFKPDDKDTLILVDNPVNFKITRQIRLHGNCIFEWKRMSADEFIQQTLNFNLGMLLGKFLVPDFVKEIGMTIDDLKKLEPMLDKLDERHQYERVIYDSYIQNNDFILTKEQLYDAYKVYLEERNQ